MIRRLLHLFRSATPVLRRRELLHLISGAALGSGAARAADREGGSLPGAQVWVSYFRSKFVWGYVNRHSIEPGEPFDLMLSTGPDQSSVGGHVEFFRVERASLADGQRLIWRSPPVTVQRQPVLRTAASVGVQWVPAWQIDTAGWPPGCYTADFVHAGSGARDPQIAQLVVRNPRRSGAILLKLCTNTYQAYNAWGGHSLYPTENEGRGGMVSFDRPCGPAFFEYDVYLARWLEDLAAREGFEVDYATNFDVHYRARLLDGYALVACGAHDEYWSKEEFDAFEHRIFRRGRNTIFFGANTAYFQVRYADVDRPPGGEDWGRQLLCHKSADDPIARRHGTADPLLLITARFREQGRRPENMLAGIAYQDWFPPDAPGVPYYVVSTDAPFFAGTGYRVGDVAADVVGYEWDNRDPAGDGARLWRERDSRIAELPLSRLQVLFQGAASGEKTPNGRAEAVYFESAAGARVFSTGTIRWAWGLGKEPFVRAPFVRFNENLVLALMR